MSRVKQLSVGDVAKRTGVSVATLHFYEQKGLIFSTRNAGNQRRYHRDVLRRVSIIRAAQQVGLSLRDIKTQFDSLPEGKPATQENWQVISREWHTQLSDRIEKMTRLRDKLAGCIGCGCLSMENCPIYNPDDEVAARGSGAQFL